ncbi:Uncharacterised protein [Bordetella pertussis]|nr:Uncharacterised protein [Bordetella pertussis]
MSRDISAATSPSIRWGWMKAGARICWRSMGRPRAKPRCRRRDTRHSSFMWRILPGRAVLGPTSTH